MVKRCHGCDGNWLQKSIIFKSLVLLQNFGNASILVYVVPEPENHWCLQLSDHFIISPAEKSSLTEIHRLYALLLEFTDFLD